VIEVQILSRDLVPAALDLLKAIEADPAGRFFTPHPFTRKAVEQLASAPGKDLYYLMVREGRAVAYGLLRGWNEGFAVPSLGLAVAPGVRGQGLGRTMMEFLHGAAQGRGADRIRLRVHPENEKAVALYRSLGYAFEPPDPITGLMVGTRKLP